MKAHSKPWIARFVYKDKPYGSDSQHCGGTIISKSVVLTAGHCLRSNHSKYIVAVGDHDILVKDGEQMIGIAEILRPGKDIGISGN